MPGACVETQVCFRKAQPQTRTLSFQISLEETPVCPSGSFLLLQSAGTIHKFYVLQTFANWNFSLRISALSLQTIIHSNYLTLCILSICNCEPCQKWLEKFHSIIPQVTKIVTLEVCVWWGDFYNN